MTRRLAGAVASCLALLAGLWLVLAPFALGVQPADADWKDETFTDVWTGIGLAVLGLTGLIAFSAALARYVHDQGMIAPRRVAPPAEDAHVPAAAPNGQGATNDLDQLLAPLIAALTDDLNRDRDRERGSVNGATEHQPTLRRTADPSQDLPGATR